MPLDEETIRNAYDLVVEMKIPVYDIIFVVLAEELGVKLKTFDGKQAAIFKARRESN
jgi:predicted nucleic acid-binding protein